MKNKMIDESYDAYAEAEWANDANYAEHLEKVNKEVITGIWIDINDPIYKDTPCNKLIVKFEDGSTIFYNQNKWPRLIATHILILPE